MRRLWVLPILLRNKPDLWPSAIYGAICGAYGVYYLLRIIFGYHDPITIIMGAMICTGLFALSYIFVLCGKAMHMLDEMIGRDQERAAKNLERQKKDHAKKLAAEQAEVYGEVVEAIESIRKDSDGNV